MRSATLVLTFCSTIVVFGQETAPASGPASRPSGDDVASAPASRAESKPAPPDAASLLDAVAFRGLGPASCSGRIGDLAVDPRRRGTWYVAAASGGVWKTVNAGTTFEPIFDGQTSYSIGCLAVNPSRPDEVWVGTGENNSQRSVGYGDGVYVSSDGGAHWRRVGLERSEHVGKILIHPTKPDVVYVAAQGPLWSSGGERGLYKTEDGGKTWRRILHVSDDAGVSEVVADPRDPDVLYAAAYQRRRHVWTLHDGGPDSGLYKSTDGGATWSKLARGLPTVHMGRIGLAIPPTKGSRVYAIVEAQEGASGVYVSENAGATFEKRSSYVSTSPQYYQELVCCPHDADRVYSLDTYLHVSDDAGRTWRQAGEADKHVDNHALIVDPADPDHLLVGCDGGLYESFDRARTWRFFPNLPLAQFYRVTVDDSEPFFFVYGGTQDNNTLGAPSRTASASGVVNADWFVTVGGDGFTARVEPGEPNVVYSEWQHGGLIRFDRRTGEALDIKPRPDLGEEGYRWNWDAPFLISPHRKTRLWFGAERVFRSDDRGDSWTVASGDLTRRLDRDTLQVMGRWWAMDAVAKHDSTSHYGNLLALDESPRVEGLLYAGSDDGLIHVTEDGGANWRRIDAFPGVPDLTPCVALVASRHAADAVYAVFGNHRAGDFKPYVLRSDDRGRTWRSIAGDLPERGNVWCLAEDHVRPDLLWVGAEFGLWTTFDGGARWHRLKAGLPPAPVRDLAIQRRDDALVAATFGRGLHVIDDLAPLRAIAAGFGDAPSALLDARDAKLFVPARPLGGGGRGAQGSSYFTAPNPEFGVAFHVYLRDAFKSKRSVRREEEKKLEAETRPVPRPTFDEVREERREESAQVVVEILDASGALVRRLSRDAKRGLSKVAWDLRAEPAGPSVDGGGGGRGYLVAPGAYVAVAWLKPAAAVDAGVREKIGETRFRVAPLREPTLAPQPEDVLAAHRARVSGLLATVQAAAARLADARKEVAALRAALRRAPGDVAALAAEARTLEVRLDDLGLALEGDPLYGAFDMPEPPSILGRAREAGDAFGSTTYGPTAADRADAERAARAFEAWSIGFRQAVDVELPRLGAAADAAGAPWSPGRPLPRRP